MSLTQFAMVEELASLIKDNLPCKHLVLSIEEALVSFLEDDTSSDGVMELEPMNPYHRLLIHRLADIFGFSHESVGEGDDRHLILERCPETSIPAVLVSDLICQYDEFQSPKMSHILSRRKETTPELLAETPSSQLSLEEKEAAYFAARERIFLVDDSKTKEPIKQKPQHDLVVARRMIAHALGQRINTCNTEVSAGKTDDNIKDERKNASNLVLKTSQEAEEHPSFASSHAERKVQQKQAERTPVKVGVTGPGKNEVNLQNDTLTEEHRGAAKRIFAHALGFHPVKNSVISKCREAK